jgi:DNA oxidative demethylase
MDFIFRPEFLNRAEQEELLRNIREVVRLAPLFTPRMPKSNKQFSVQMTNCGPLGWVSDALGYRYQAVHPMTGEPWPPMPPLVLKAWSCLSEYDHPPEACLVNFYSGAAKMGLHQDRDEADFTAPVVSLSLGDTCIFRIGGIERSNATKSLRLASGDAVVLGGRARLAFHGVDRIIPNTSTLLQSGGRINLTMRRVTKPE